MKRKIISAITAPSNLAWSSTTERAIDRIAALGMCSSTGARLIKLRWGNDRHQWGPTLHWLARELRKRFLKLHRDRAATLANAALTEWLLPMCIKCGGAGSIAMPLGGAMACTACNGVGLHRFHDAQRATLLKCDVKGVDRWARHLSACHQMLTETEAVVWRTLAKQLGPEHVEAMLEGLDALPLASHVTNVPQSAIPSGAGDVAPKTYTRVVPTPIGTSALQIPVFAPLA